MFRLLPILLFMIVSVGSANAGLVKVTKAEQASNILWSASQIPYFDKQTSDAQAILIQTAAIMYFLRSNCREHHEITAIASQKMLATAQVVPASTDTERSRTVLTIMALFLGKGEDNGCELAYELGELEN